ncbi:MAG: glycerol-3-phosphate dehydrogenase subunit GlpB [Thermodesulfobacteriota bacterium]
MSYDCLILGGGIAGLSCGIRLAEKGRRVAVLAAGASALHFSSGCVDLLGRAPGKSPVIRPFDELEGFCSANPDHPYAKLSPARIREALSFFSAAAEAGGNPLFHNGEENHFHITGLGMLKPTYLSPGSVFSEEIAQAFFKKKKVVIANFAGFRDFYPGLAAGNVAGHALFSGCKVTSAQVDLSGLANRSEGHRELRSIDIARLFEDPRNWDFLADAVSRVADGADFVALPACLGISRHREVYRIVRERAGCLLYEVPTLPPSILGMRLDLALRNRLAELSGVFIAGDRAISGKTENGKVRCVTTRINEEPGFSARAYVLATGSYFSGGLITRHDMVAEPVFGLSVQRTLPRNTWYHKEFLAPAGHPFFKFGVVTDRDFRAVDAGGNVVENLFCAGSVLAGYDPVAECSGCGVALGTGFAVAEKVEGLL